MRILDLETTGLESDSEIVEIAIIDENANVLLNTLVKPLYAKSWKDAERIHKISPAMVENAPTIAELLPKIIEIIKNEEIVIYNAQFDTQFLPIYEHAKKVHCCMLLFAEHYGEYSEYFGDYRWQKLSFAFDYISIQKKYTLFHRTLNDCLATLDVWEYLHCESIQKEVQAKKQEIANKKEIEKTISIILRKERWQKESEKQIALNNWEKTYLSNNPNIRLNENELYISVWRNKYKDYYAYSTWLEMYFYFKSTGKPYISQECEKQGYEVIFDKIGFVSFAYLEKYAKNKGKILCDTKKMNKYVFFEKNMYSKGEIVYDLREVKKFEKDIFLDFFSTRPEGSFTKTEIKNLKKRVEDFVFVGYGKNRNNHTYYELYKEK